jgi:DNA gyrase subunit A
MEFDKQRIVDVSLEEEMKKSFIDYAMSVIVARALPDVRDGLKPVHRRIMHSMYELGLTPDKAYRKSARIVGDTLGKYHPHGETAIYDAMVRLAQEFSTRYPLVDGQGNFGSIDGDSPAAMRYTEAKISKIGVELMTDIEKETVDFADNFDGTTKEPKVLPSKFPNLLVNGSSGIAVGMATNIPPHCIEEIVDALIALIENPEMEIDELLEIVKGPDFPTGAYILGTQGIKDAYRTGRGRVVMRSKTDIEPMTNSKTRIVVNELPYQVNKARLIEKIAELVRDKKLEGISEVRDESDKNGIRIAIELKRDVRPSVVLNYLFKHTQMQDTFGIIMLALVDSQPKVLNLKEMLSHYIAHQKDMVTKRTVFDLKKAEARIHILEGLLIALDNIDAVIALVRSSKTDQIARAGLMSKFGLSELQAEAILQMRIRRLTGLERDKIKEEHSELLKTIAYLKSILADESILFGIIKKELKDIRQKHGDGRRSVILPEQSDIDIEDLIQKQDVVIVRTHQGYVKRTPLNTYKSQKRGGRGVMGMETRDEDFVEDLFITTTHQRLLFFSNLGKVYELKAHEIPEAGRQAKGTAIINLIQITPGEKIQTVIPIKPSDKEQYLIMATKNGFVKKTSLSEYDNIRKNGITGITLREDDILISALLTDGDRELLLASKHGKSIRFHESGVRAMGRAATGVKGMEMDYDDQIIDIELVRDNGFVVSITEKGYGKRTALEEYRLQGRSGSGIIASKLTDRTGRLVALKIADDTEDLVMINSNGITIRIKTGEIPVMGRNTQGVTLMKTNGLGQVASVAKVPGEDTAEASIKANEGEDND